MSLEKKDAKSEELSPQKKRMLELKAIKEANNQDPQNSSPIKNEIHVSNEEPVDHDKYSKFRDSETQNNTFDEFIITKPKKKPSKKKVVLSLPIDIVECIDQDTDDELNFKQSHVIEQILRHYYTATGKLKKNNK